jgi:predicted amidohydrolase YtcJ
MAYRSESFTRLGAAGYAGNCGDVYRAGAECARQAQRAAAVPELRAQPAGVVASYAAHPLGRLLDAGVRVSLNSDDPTFFGADVLDEMEICVARLGVSLRELATMSEHAAAAAFVDGGTRAGLVARVREGWARLI